MQFQYYSIRLLIEHPTLTASDISILLEMESTNCWDFSDVGKKYTMWNYESWTKDSRFYFDEISSVIDCLKDKTLFLSYFKTNKTAKISIVAQLNGGINIGDLLKPDTMKAASDIGVYVGVEVFPILSYPTTVPQTSATSSP
jgi:hypothetical protein